MLWSLRAGENVCRIPHLPSWLLFNAGGNHRPASLTKEIPGGVGILWVYLTILPRLLRLCYLMTCAVSGRVSYFEAELRNSQYSISDRPCWVVQGQTKLASLLVVFTSNYSTVTIRHKLRLVSEIVTYCWVTSLNLCIGSDSFISIQPLGWFSRNQSPVRRPVWLWHAAS